MTYATESAQPPGDTALARLAERQHGVVGLGQLGELGLGAPAVRSRVARGRLHRVHRGVYAVGHPILTGAGRMMAAVLACGSGSVLSHRSAAALWGLRASDREAIDVTAPGRAGRSRPGIDAHRATSLAAGDITTVRGIPCTSVPRTLLDLADLTNRRGLERALDQAEILRLLDANELERVLTQAGQGRHGAKILKDLLADHHPGDTLTRSELEERFLALCAGAGVAPPRVNAWIVLPGGAIQADFLWTRQRLIVETDGHAAHGTRAAFERDRRRDQRLMAAGYRVMRCTWRQVVARPGEVSATLVALLA